MTAANYIGTGMIAAAFLAIFMAMAKDVGARAMIGIYAFSLVVGGGLILTLSPP